MTQTEIFIIGIVIGLFLGWLAGTWSEQRLWLDAICGRERIAKVRTDRNG